MQDTLRHLVGNTIDRSDSNKFMFVLNQMDTAAREDNSEEIVGAWQRALSQKGLTAGRFYTIYNKDIAPPIDNETTRTRFEAKCDADMSEIKSRIDQVEAERAYRIVGSMEKEAYRIRDNAVPTVTRLKQTWKTRVLRFDLAAWSIIALIVLGASIALGTLGALFTFLLSLLASPITMLGSIAAIVVFVLALHFFIRSQVGKYMLGKLRDGDDPHYAQGFAHNTRFYRTLFRSSPVRWNKRSQENVEEVLEQASDFVQKLNDQYTQPSG